jgi:type-F conjugative transfer system pilin assembly protein TrbC
MAKTQLLLVVALFVLSVHHDLMAAEAFQPRQLTEADFANAKRILGSAQHVAAPGITHQPGASVASPASFYVFVSLRLGGPMLKQLLADAKKYQAVLVLRGLKNNSFKDTVAYLQSLGLQEEAEGFLIDPPLFQQFDVTQVPTYVLAHTQNCPPGMSCKVAYDKLAGTVTPKFALEQFVKTGDLTMEAAFMLEGKDAQ